MDTHTHKWNFPERSHFISHESGIFFFENGLVKLRHVLLSDRQQELILLRFFGEENNPCAKLRYTKQKCPETSLLLGHLQILAHWNLFSALAHVVVEVNSKYLELTVEGMRANCRKALS